jgi:hypothetical protein
MTILDLTLPAHQEALRALCALCAEVSDVPLYLDGMAAIAGDPLKTAARTLATPSLAAEALRGLLKWMGVPIAPFEDQFAVRLPCVRVDLDGDTLAIRIVRVNDAAAELLKVLTARVTQFQLNADCLPAIFLALLAIPEDASSCPRCNAMGDVPCSSVGPDSYCRGAPLKRQHHERTKAVAAAKANRRGLALAVLREAGR